jgi:hypothetical protein
MNPRAVEAFDHLTVEGRTLRRATIDITARCRKARDEA